MEPSMLLGVVFVFIGLFLLYKLNPINVDPFLRSEAERCLYKNCEIDEEWNSQGRVYRKSIALITTEDGRKKFVRTGKLVDTGILH